MTRPFIRKTLKSQFILNGWRYRTALRLSAANRFCFGPMAGYGNFVTVTEDDATLNFDAIIQHARELVQRSKEEVSRYTHPTYGIDDLTLRSLAVSPIQAYEKALSEAELELSRVRIRLNEVIERVLANRRVSKWAGSNVVIFPKAVRGFDQPHLIAAE